MSQTLNPASLPPDARLTLTQQASAGENGLSLTISGTGWVPPDFDAIDWDMPISITPVGPVPGSPAQVTGRFTYTVETDFENQQVRWSITSQQAAAGEDEQQDQTDSEITISLLDKGWAILRSANGTAIPMMAYSKRRVSASGTGTPPVTATPLAAISFVGIDLRVTSYQNNTVAGTWSIEGEEV